MVESVETVIGQIDRKSGGLGMSYVSPVVENDFKDRLNKCVDIIKNSSIKYQVLGFLEATQEMIIRPAVISTFAS